MSQKINIAICGVGGYVGKELLSLVLKHPQLNLVGVLSRKPQATLVGVPAFTIDQLKQQSIDVLFLATPPQVSMDIVAALHHSHIKIIDLSGAFRLSHEEFKQWYGVTHQLPDLLSNIQYGLMPWAATERGQCQLIANPGCYATGVLMALLPLLTAGTIAPQGIVVDAKSGVSGAGKQARADLMFAEMQQNFFPYKVGEHRHTPEILNALASFSGKACGMHFVTHMLPIVRGMSISLYADVLDHSTTDQQTAVLVAEAYKKAYNDYPFARCHRLNNGDTEQDQVMLSVKSVVGTPNVHIAYQVVDGKVLVFSSIDNLLKGAASQAIENVNAQYGFPLETGLLD